MEHSKGRGLRGAYAHLSKTFNPVVENVLEIARDNVIKVALANVFENVLENGFSII